MICKQRIFFSVINAFVDVYAKVGLDGPQWWHRGLKMNYLEWPPRFVFIISTAFMKQVILAEVLGIHILMLSNTSQCGLAKV